MLTDATLLSRIEDAGLNASAPPQQRWLDGWLVRFSPGSAKRARCINPVAAGRTSVDEKLRLCKAFYAEVALPLCIRITPFSAPGNLDQELEARGFASIDDTRVMVSACQRATVDASLPSGYRMDCLGHHAFAAVIGAFRGATRKEQDAHAERLHNSPVPFHGYVLHDADGAPLACGQIAREGDIVGLYDVYTAVGSRGKGLASALCSRLLGIACGEGANVAYLQVDAGNLPARRVYQRLGFIDGYAYHYRTPPPGIGLEAAPKL